jgi:hypothetical protein
VALTQQSSQPSHSSEEDSNQNEKKKGETMVQEEEEKQHKEEPSYYPPALEWDEQHPSDVQQEPPVDAMYCQYCLITPCLFIQWQE